MDQTKITVKIYKPFITKLNDQFDKLHIKRDRFLNSMIQSETAYLANDMEGKCLSSKAKRYIINELGRLDTVTVNVGVDKATADKLNEVVKQSNMVRDAFINRLILFLLSPDAFLNLLELPLHVTGSEFKAILPSVPTSPLKAIEGVHSDPLFYLHVAAKERFKTGLYLLDLPPIFVGLSCYLDDAVVPGTKAYAQAKKLDDLLDMFKSDPPKPN